MLRVVVFSGIPGSGKSILAEHAARRLHAALLSKDIIEAALRRSDVGADRSGWAGYEVMTALAEHELQLGVTVVLDSVAGTQSIRATWHDLASRYGASLRVIECVVSDQAVHRARILGRRRNIPGWPELTWDEVERVRAGFKPWSSHRLLLDAARPLDENIAALDDYLGQE